MDLFNNNDISVLNAEQLAHFSEEEKRIIYNFMASFKPNLKITNKGIKQIKELNEITEYSIPNAFEIEERKIST